MKVMAESKGSAALLEALGAIILANVEEHGWSGVLHVQGGGEVLAAVAAGLANRSEGIPIAMDTRFQLASGCKAFTAVAICQLVAERRLGFDSLLADCLHESFPAFDSGVTVGQLLSHTSGIPDYFDEESGADYADLWKERPMYGMESPADFLPMFGGLAQKFKPGTRFEYNNAGYILLGLIVERLRGRSFAECIQSHLFDPAGMWDSGYFPLDRLPERSAQAYIDLADGTWKTNIYSVPKVGGPDGGAFSTARDMTRFWKALADGRLLERSVVQAMATPAAREEEWPKGPQYGMGIWLIPSAQEPLTIERQFVCGWDPGVSCLSTHSASEDLTVTILTNGNYSYWKVHKAVVEALQAHA